MMAISSGPEKGRCGKKDGSKGTKGPFGKGSVGKGPNTMWFKT